MDADRALRLEPRTLDSGAKLVHQAPPPGAASFSISYLAEAGWRFDPPAERGLATSVAELLSAGEGRLSRRDLAQALDSLGATLDSECGPERSRVTLWGPEAHRDRLLPLFIGSIRTPRFDSSELDRELRDLHERDLREKTQPASRSEWELGRLLFRPGHPLRESGIGTRATRTKVDRSAVRQFHRSRYTPTGGVFVATTRLATEEMSRTLDRLLRGWGGEDPPTRELPRGSPAGPKSISVNLSGRSQVELRLGGAALRRSDPGFAAAALANEILGGRPMLSRLFQKIREKEGLAYHCSSELTALRSSGLWVGEAGCGPKDVPRVQELLQSETDRLRTQAVPQEELDRIRESAIGAIRLELEDTASAHALAVEVADLELPADHLISWPSTLRSVGRRDVQEAAARLFDPSQLRSVTAGPLSRG